MRKRGEHGVGFVDPYIIYKNPNPTETTAADNETNLMRAFVKQKEKRRLLFPYNFE